MGNPNKTHPSGPCSSCNSNGGLWLDEPKTVHCLRSRDSNRHVMRGDDATIHRHICWRSKSEDFPLSAVGDLMDQIKAKAKLQR